MQRPERMLITKFTAARITKLVATGVRASFSHLVLTLTGLVLSLCQTQYKVQAPARRTQGPPF